MKSFILLLLLQVLTFSLALDIDENGYVAFCPCMGM